MSDKSDFSVIDRVFAGDIEGFSAIFGKYSLSLIQISEPPRPY